VVVNARKGLSVGGKLDFTKVALQPLLMDVAGIDRLIGTGDLAVDFVAAGGSVAALMRGLDGQGRLALGAGEIRGIDVPAMLAKLDASDLGPTEKTVFDALDASFTIRNGDLFNDDLALRSPYLRASGSGRIGLAARDFDYRLQATALQGADGVDRIAVPLSVTGPWAAPKVSLDLEALAQERLGEQAKAAEDELRRRAAEELGQQEGESLEDAAKRKLQETLDQEAGSLLQQLLGGN
jgi:AsmA protein